MAWFILFMGVKSQAQTFQDISSAQFVSAPSNSLLGTGVSFYDFNKDGWDDLSFCQTGLPPIFYVNNEGNFEPIDFGIANDIENKHLTWADYDNDGDADLLLTRKDGPCSLYQNDGNMVLTDVTAGAGLPDDATHHVNGACWGDFDKDGWLDVYLCHFNDQFYPVQYENWLMKNMGDGTFVNVTPTAGCGNGHSRSFQASFLDYNNDGWPDIHVANDRPIYPNALFKNNGDGTFEDVSYSSNVAVEIDCMSTTIGDYDNDEDLDIYVTNGVYGNVMLNNQDGIFSDSTEVTGLVVNAVCWGGNWADFENDGDQDLYVCTAANSATWSYNWAYRNDGPGQLPEIQFVSFPDDDIQTWTSVCGDVNNDGFVDLANSADVGDNTPIWLNDATSGNHYIKIGVQGTVSNRDAVGTWVKVYTGDLVQSRYTASGEDYLGQDSQREIIGLGTTTMIDSISFWWPSGFMETMYDVASDQTIEVIEGFSVSASTEADGLLELCDGESVAIQALPATGYTYDWSTGDTTQTIVVSESTEVWVTITNEYGINATSDTLEVEVFTIQPWFIDNDGDGFGDGGNFIMNCTPLEGYSNLDGDCDDNNPNIYPGAPPLGENDDNNCDGVVDQQETNCPADFNNDSFINTADLLIFLTEFGCVSACTVDLNNDGIIDTTDLLDFLTVFSTFCPF